MKGATMGTHQGILALATAFLILGLTHVNGQVETYKASQCFKSRGIPKVAFNCDPNHMIKIQRAFHGISIRDKRLLTLTNKIDRCSPSPGHKASNCTYCEGDCVDDSMNMVYDWSTCMGNTTCLRTVMQSYMPSCPGKDKFSDYLQVEYQCIPRSQVIDVCTNTQKWLSEGYLMSPNYPDHYPVEQDCMCKIQTDWNSKVVLTFFDLLLETKQGRCRADWLMLRQRGQKHRHCGAIMTGTKNVTSETNSITLQFHSDKNDNHTQNFQYFTRNLKGFWLYFRAEPDSSMQITCRRLTHADNEVKEIWADDADYNEVVSTKEAPVDSGGQRPDGPTDKQGIEEGKAIMGDDRDVEDNNVKKQTPKRKPKIPQEGQENAVDKQSSGEESVLIKKTHLIASLVLLKIICMFM